MSTGRIEKLPNDLKKIWKKSPQEPEYMNYRHPAYNYFEENVFQIGRWKNRFLPLIAVISVLVSCIASFITCLVFYYRLYNFWFLVGAGIFTIVIIAMIIVVLDVYRRVTTPRSMLLYRYLGTSQHGPPPKYYLYGLYGKKNKGVHHVFLSPDVRMMRKPAYYFRIDGINYCASYVGPVPEEL